MTCLPCHGTDCSDIDGPSLPLVAVEYASSRVKGRVDQPVHVTQVARLGTNCFGFR